MAPVPKADLHIHTTASDGQATPEEIIDKAAENGLYAVSITDHDTYAGYHKAKARGTEKNVEVIPGMEITCDYNGRECHMLAYGFDIGSKELLSFVHQQKLRRNKRAKVMISNLNKLGFDISFDDVMAESGTLNISRNHLAAAMVSKGYETHKKAVFLKYLGDHASAYYKTEYAPLQEVIEIVKSCGGVAILAHPGLYFVEEDITNIIKAGIDGFECIHPSHNYMLQKRYTDICDEYRLLKTGGSDYHGHKKAEHNLFGTVAVEKNWVDRLLEVCEQAKKH